MPANTHFPGLEQPSENALLRRYLPANRFEQMLRENTIYLCRLGLLEDDFEGATPTKTRERIERWIRSSGIDPRSVNPTTFPSYHARERHYVSCWFEGDAESDAMWKLYAREGGVAIETTYEQLVRPFDPSFWAGKIVYGSFDQIEDESVNEFNRVFLKRQEFQHEREIRIAKKQFVFHKNADERMRKHPFGSQEWLDAMYDQPNGINQPVILPELLNRVVVHPSADQKRVDEVKRSLANVGVGCAVVPSTMSRKPFWGYTR